MELLAAENQGAAEKAHLVEEKAAGKVEGTAEEMEVEMVGALEL